MLDLLSGSTFCGIQLIEDINMTEPGEPYQVDRTWKERLFSRPWRPLKAKNTIVPQIPSTEVLSFENKLIAHPEIIKIIKHRYSSISKVRK